MKIKLRCFARNWIGTIFVAAMIVIILVRLSHHFLYKENNIITTFARGTFSSIPLITYNVVPNSSKTYEDLVSTFNETNRFRFLRLNPRNISGSSFNKKALKLSRIDALQKKQSSNILHVPAEEKKEKKLSTTKSGLTTPSPILRSEIITDTFNLYDYQTKMIKETFLKRISKDFRLKMAKRLPPEEMKIPETCSYKTIGNSCQKGGCLQLQLPTDPQIRLEQLIRPENLHPNTNYLKVMLDMGNAIPGFYDIILITGASSNHYEESKALLYNIHANVLPHLRNFTFIYYNLGLTVEQKEDISSMCKCQMLDFPFDKFPSHVSFLKCYTWKPIIVNAHAPHCNVIHWVDASIRFFNNPSYFKELLRRVKVRGFQSGTNRNPISYVTLREMFHFFGDEACVYLPYTESMSGFTMFLNEPLIKWGILEPWTACALNESCMCLDYVKDPKLARISCQKRKKPYDYGWCHRFDQSALGIIVRKLFREKSDHLFLPNIRDFIEIKRGDKWNDGISERNNKKL